MHVLFCYFSCWCLMCCYFHAIAQSNASDQDEGDSSEYCQHETMTIKCRWKSEVIVMTSARWGRMKTNRCLNIHSNFLSIHGQDPMFLGCSEDVISIVDQQCSGRSECDFHIHDQLSARTPCYPDLARYLESGYKCVRVVQESRTCSVGVTNEEQFIPSSSQSVTDSSAASNCGSKSHPWRLEAAVGQRINISLLVFTNTRALDVTCQQYGYVVEKSIKKNISLCFKTGLKGGLNHEQPKHRDNVAHMSDTNSVEIILPVNDRQTENHNYLVKFTAVGCTNMIPPENAWLKRSNNDIVIGCYLSHQTWQLKCDGHEWKGQVGTCPDTYSGTIASVQLMNNSKDTLPVKIAMGVIVVAAACVCLLVISIGCFCTKRYSRKSGKKILEHPTQLKQVSLLTTNGADVDNVQHRLGTNSGFKFSSTQATNENYSEHTDGSIPAKHQNWNQTTPQYFVLDSERVA